MNTPRLRLPLLLVALCATLAPASFAEDSAPPPPPTQQGPGPMRFNPERRLARLTEELGLTAEQQNALHPILLAQAHAMKSANDPTLSDDQRRAKLRTVFQEFRPQINAVLTPAQQEKMAQMRPPRPRDGRGGPEGRPGKDGNRPPPPPEAGE